MMEDSLSKKGNKFLKVLSVSALIGLFSLGTSVYAESAESVELLLQGETNLDNLAKATLDTEKNSEFLLENNSKYAGLIQKAGSSEKGMVCGNDTCMVSVYFSNYAKVQQGEIRGAIIRQHLPSSSSSTYPSVDRDMYDNTFISTDSDVNGGLIYNGIIGYNSTAKFLTINNKMYDNYIEASANVRGGLVYNGNVYQSDTTSISSLTSDMTNNTVAAQGDVYGGLIYNYAAGQSSQSSIGEGAQDIFNGVEPADTFEPGSEIIDDPIEPPAAQKAVSGSEDDQQEVWAKSARSASDEEQRMRYAKSAELTVRKNVERTYSSELLDEETKEQVPAVMEAEEDIMEDRLERETSTNLKKNLEDSKDVSEEREKDITISTMLNRADEDTDNISNQEKDKGEGIISNISDNPGKIDINPVWEDTPEPATPAPAVSKDEGTETTFNGIKGNIIGNTIAAGNDVYGGIVLNSNDTRFAIYYPGPFEDIPVPINNSSAEISQIDAVISGNEIYAGGGVFGGIIYNDSIIGKISGEITNNYIESEKVIGSVLYNSGSMGLGDIVIANNTSTADGDAIYNSKVINILGDTTLTNNISNGKYRDIYNAGTIRIKNKSKLTTTGTVEGDGTMLIEENSTWNASNSIKGQEVVLDEGAKINLLSYKQTNGETTYGTLNLKRLAVYKDVSINAINNHTYAHQLGDVMLNGNLNFIADVDLANAKMDSLEASSLDTKEQVMPKIYVNGLNLISDSKDTKTEVYFTNDILKDVVENRVEKAGYDSDNKYQTTAYSPIYKYNVGYENRDDAGYFVFTRGTGNGYSDFNPSVMVSPVATQAAVQSTMNQTFNYVFEHADTFMTLPSMDRVAKLNSNSYALSTDYNENLGTLDINQNNRGVWVRPYSAFENMPLKHGPKVDLISYGTFIGFDSDVHRLKHGWANVGTAYIGYNGAQVKYDNVDTSMNGGMIGLTETFYKGNFFTALTATAGAGVADSTTMYGHEDQAFLMGGIGSKTGYNLEFKGGKFIVQPILFMSYSIVKGFDYTNAAGVRVNSDPAHTVQINPSVRFIGNFDGWQPYASVGMVWDVLHESNSEANGVKLPEMYTKPYVQYGVGVQRNVNENFSAFGQAMVRNGGRNGISLTLGFRWAIGKDGKDKVSNPSRKISKNNRHLSMQDEDKTVIKKLSVTQKAHLMNTTRTSMNAIIE